MMLPCVGTVFFPFYPFTWEKGTEGMRGRIT